MKKYYGHTLLYLHETIALGSGRGAQFAAAFGELYQPMMEELGARLFAIWETTPYNGHWPQVTVIWEIDAFADYARYRPRPVGGRQPSRRRGEMVAVPVRAGRHGRGPIMYAGKLQQDPGATAGRPSSVPDW